MHVNAFNRNVAIPCIMVENDSPRAMDHNQIAPMITRIEIIWTAPMGSFDLETTVGETVVGGVGGETEPDRVGETVEEATGEDEDDIIDCCKL